MALKSEPLVSVVTPVYNTEKYLAECIESVLAQTYPHWEYIIVNNCSKDRSLEIAQRYAGQDARIRIHNNTQFLNQMQNWNHAMRQISAESKYCKVVHADDWLFPECLSRMVEVAEANPSVGIVSSYRLDEVEVNLDGLPYSSPVTAGREICRLTFLNDFYVFGSPTSLLIRSDLIRGQDQFYDEANIHADKAVCFDILQGCDFGFVHQVLTYTRRHNETTTTFMQRLNTHRLGGLAIFKKYGPIYLDSEEYEQCLKAKLESYYRFLGRQVFELKDNEFWNYHQNGLKALGHPLSWAKVIKAALQELLNFEMTIKRVRRAMKNKPNKPQSVGDVKKWNIISRSET